MVTVQAITRLDQKSKERHLQKKRAEKATPAMRN